jgi:hypothetical protein
MRRRRRVAVIAALLLLTVLLARLASPGSAGRSGLDTGDRGARAGARAPEDVRIRVEVQNATRVRGLARRATLHLRDRGFDVVEIGTASEQRDSTLVLDRSGHPEWARLVAGALGTALVETRIDTSRYLDVTVLIGADWTPPAEPFYP